MRTKAAIGVGPVTFINQRISHLPPSFGASAAVLRLEPCAAQLGLAKSTPANRPSSAVVDADRAASDGPAGYAGVAKRRQRPANDGMRFADQAGAARGNDLVVPEEAATPAATAKVAMIEVRAILLMAIVLP
jgi:hypothetical protein